MHNHHCPIEWLWYQSRYDTPRFAVLVAHFEPNEQCWVVRVQSRPMLEQHVQTVPIERTLCLAIHQMANN